MLARRQRRALLSFQLVFWATCSSVLGVGGARAFAAEPEAGLPEPEPPPSSGEAVPLEPPGPSESSPAPPGPSAAPPPELPAPAPAPAPPQTIESTPAPEAVSADEIARALAADNGAVDNGAADNGAASSGAAAPDTVAEAPAPATGAGALLPSSLNPEMALVLDMALAYFSDDEPLQTGAHDPSVTGFNLQALEMSLGAAVDPYFRFDSSIVLTRSEVELEEAYGTTLGLPFGLQARFGKFLHRFGRLNSTHPHAWDFVDQPFALGRVFGGEGGGGLGVELSWLSLLPWYAEFVGSVLGADGADNARSFYGAESPSIESLSDFLYVLALKQFFPLGHDWSTLWGLSAAMGPNATSDDNYTDVFGTDLYVKYRPITRFSQFAIAWQSEVFYRRRQIQNDPLQDGVLQDDLLQKDLLQDVSLYTQLVLRLSQRWGVGGRYEFGSPALGLDHESGLDDLDPEWTENRQRVSGKLSFSPSEFSRLGLQGSYDLPGWQNRGIFAAFLAIELVAGAHGAHTF